MLTVLGLDKHVTDKII